MGSATVRNLVTAGLLKVVDGKACEARDADDLALAISLAALAHAGQVDKAGQPYILHPLRVMLRVASDDARIAAVLHDTVEDTSLSLLTIRSGFGDAMADAVDALTRRRGESYEAFIERCGADVIAREVKLADLADNMDLSRLPSITDTDLRRVEKYRDAATRLRGDGTIPHPNRYAP